MLINFETIKSRMLDIYQQSWYSAINNSSRLETYSLLKHDFIFEPYLDCIKDKRFRIAMTRFRTSSHNLFIEKGRHLNIKKKSTHLQYVYRKYDRKRVSFFTFMPSIFRTKTKIHETLLLYLAHYP